MRFINHLSPAPVRMGYIGEWQRLFAKLAPLKVFSTTGIVRDPTFVRKAHDQLLVDVLQCPFGKQQPIPFVIEAQTGDSAASLGDQF